MDGRIAFCFSGQLRKLKNLYRVNKTYSKYTNIFFHTWEHETNPNLHVLDEHFSSAYKTIETYNKFDELIKGKYLVPCDFQSMNIVDVYRYKYAQFYTVYMSLKKAISSPGGETFKYFVRSRTDILNVSQIFDDETLYGSYLGCEQDNTKNFVLNNASSLVNSKYSHFDHIPQGVCLTNILSRFEESLLIADHHFVLSREAVLKILNYSIEEFLELASKYSRQLDSISLYHYPSSPLIWDKIFKHLGIGIIQYNESGTHSIFREHGTAQVKEFYGYIG